MTTPHTEDDEINLLDVVLVFVENLRLLVIAPLLTVVVSIGITYLVPPTFTASTKIIPPQQQQSSAVALANQLGALSGVVGAAAGLKSPADMYVAMIKSRTIADRLIEQFKLRERYAERLDDDARRELSNRTRVSAGRDGLITIEVDDTDSRQAAAIANSYVSELGHLTQNLALTEAAQRRVFFEKQLNETKNELIRADVALRSSGIGQATIKSVPQAALEALARLKAQVTAQEVRIATMRGAMTDANPDLRQATQELSALRTQLARLEQGDNLSARGSGAEYIATFRNFKYFESLFEMLAKQYEIARLDEAREGNVVQVIDIAFPPERKSKPKRMVIGALAGLSMFVFLLFVVLARRFLKHLEERDPEKMLALRRGFGVKR